MSSSLTLASQTIGFISFSITLLTLLGVYRDLLGTLRSAPTHIPLILGNLRQELLAERVYLRQRCAEGRDPFGVFPRGRLAGLPRSVRGVSTSRRRGRRRNNGDHHRDGGGETSDDKHSRRSLREEERLVEQGGEAYTRLLEVTIEDLWLEFCALERPFLIRRGLRAEAVARGDYWSDDDIEAAGSVDEEKTGNEGSGPRRRRGGRKRRPRGGTSGVNSKAEWEAAEADLRREGAKYYNTGLVHRFIWWQNKSDVQRLAEEVQRIQIRRMERDLFETDELVRLLVRERGLELATMDGHGSGGGGGEGVRDRALSASSIRQRRSGSRSRSRNMSTRERSSSRRNFREVEEREAVRRTAASPPPIARAKVNDREANVTIRRSDLRSGPRVEYEVLRPVSNRFEVMDDYEDRARTRYGRDQRNPGAPRRPSSDRG
jgi:hypothetical protein